MIPLAALVLAAAPAQAADPFCEVVSKTDPCVVLETRPARVVEVELPAGVAFLAFADVDDLPDGVALIEVAELPVEVEAVHLVGASSVQGRAEGRGSLGMLELPADMGDLALLDASQLVEDETLRKLVEDEEIRRLVEDETIRKYATAVTYGGMQIVAVPEGVEALRMNAVVSTGR